MTERGGRSPPALATSGDLRRAADQLDDEEQEHRAEQRIEEGHHVERAVEDRGAAAEQPAGDQRSGDSGEDVEDEGAGAGGGDPGEAAAHGGYDEDEDDCHVASPPALRFIAAADEGMAFRERIKFQAPTAASALR